MSRLMPVLLPKIGTVQLVLKSKREIRAHPTYGSLMSESNEWLYWNRVWYSEVALSEWLIEEFYPDKLVGHRVLELGCGTGLAGIVAAKLGAISTFSDIVPMVMDSVSEACAANNITAYRTLLLDWSCPEAMPETYGMILGSEIFYDVSFLQDLCAVLNRGLGEGGRGAFCDPNRLGFDSLQASFSDSFRMTTQSRSVEWPKRSSGPFLEKEVFIYELSRKGSTI